MVTVDFSASIDANPGRYRQAICRTLVDLLWIPFRIENSGANWDLFETLEASASRNDTLWTSQ